jgi:predicted  nucleic acid-binding Zn-ribbon protein
MPTIVEGVELRLETDGETEVIRDLEKIDDAVQDLRTEADSASEDLQKVGAASDGASEGLRRTAAAADTAGEELRSAGGGAGGLAVNLSQIAADAPFGILGVANNIEGLSQSFSRAKGQTGSFRSVLGRLAKPGNLITIATGVVSGLAVAFGDDLVGALTSSEQKLVDLEGALDGVLQFSDELGTDTEKIQAEISRLEQGLTKLEEAQRRLNEQDANAATRSAESFFADLADGLESQGFENVAGDDFRSLLGLPSQEDVDRLFDLQEQREIVEKAVSQINSKLASLRGRLLAIDTLEPIAPDLLEDLEDGADDTSDKLESVAIQLQRLRGLEGFGRSEFRTRQQAAREQLQEDVSELEIATPEYVQSAEQAGEIAEEQVNQQIVQGIRLASQLGTTLVQAFQKGEVEANKLFGQVLQIVGSAVAIANPAAGAAVSGIGSIIGSFASGGYTGAGPASRPAGIVHAGEYVMPKSAVEAAGGPAFFEQMRAMLTGSMSKADLRRAAGMPPGYQAGGMVRSLPPSAPGGSNGDVVSELRRQGDELSRLRQDLQRFAERPNLVQVDRRGSRDIVEAGQEYQRLKDPRQRG